MYKLENEINGKGKEYDKYGTLIFKGEYLNEKRNGKGKEYAIYIVARKLIFEGEYLNGKRHGNEKNIIMKMEV